MRTKKRLPSSPLSTIHPPLPPPLLPSRPTPPPRPPPLPPSRLPLPSPRRPTIPRTTRWRQSRLSSRWRCRPPLPTCRPSWSASPGTWRRSSPRSAPSLRPRRRCTRSCWPCRPSTTPTSFPRLLERYHVDQHVCALRPSAPALDSLEAITRDAEAEERQRRTRDAVEEEARIAALRRREDDDESARIRQRDEDRANAVAIVRASLNPPLPHHLKRPRDPSSSSSPSVAPPLPPSSAPLTADMEAKRREALRRVGGDHQAVEACDRLIDPAVYVLTRSSAADPRSPWRCLDGGRRGP